MKEKSKENNIETRPHNIEAEQNLLGLLLNNNENMNKIGDVLKEEHFYLPLHAKITLIYFKKHIRYTVKPNSVVNILNIDTIVNTTISR